MKFERVPIPVDSRLSGAQLMEEPSHVGGQCEHCCHLYSLNFPANKSHHDLLKNSSIYIGCLFLAFNFAAQLQGNTCLLSEP